MNWTVEMETIDLTALDSDDEFSSFGSQETDDASVVFVVEATDVPSDEENIDDASESENGNTICD